MMGKAGYWLAASYHATTAGGVIGPRKALAPEFVPRRDGSDPWPGQETEPFADNQHLLITSLDFLRTGPGQGGGFRATLCQRYNGYRILWEPKNNVFFLEDLSGPDQFFSTSILRERGREDLDSFSPTTVINENLIRRQPRKIGLEK